MLFTCYAFYYVSLYTRLYIVMSMLKTTPQNAYCLLTNTGMSFCLRLQEVRNWFCQKCENCTLQCNKSMHPLSHGVDYLLYWFVKRILFFSRQVFFFLHP